MAYIFVCHVFYCVFVVSETNSYIFTASAFLIDASNDVTLTVTLLLPNSMVISSPIFNSLDGLTIFPLTKIRSFSATSLASVRLLINLDTFKYLFS